MAASAAFSCFSKRTTKIEDTTPNITKSSELLPKYLQMTLYYVWLLDNHGLRLGGQQQTMHWDIKNDDIFCPQEMKNTRGEQPIKKQTKSETKAIDLKMT